MAQAPQIFLSMRRSGTSHISVTRRYIAPAARGSAKASRMPARYSTGDILPLRSRPSACAKCRVAAVISEDRKLQTLPGERRHQQRDAVERGRNRREIVLAHPGRRKRDQRQPEQQMKIGPQHQPVDMPHQMKEVVVVVPVDRDVDEAQNIAEKYRRQTASAARSAPCGTFSSSTMIVMMIAITPSLKASRRSFSNRYRSGAAPWR